MAVSFPSSPTTGDLYTYNNKTWQYNGEGWITFPYQNDGAIAYAADDYDRQRALAIAQANIFTNGNLAVSQENANTSSGASAGGIAHWCADEWVAAWNVSTSTCTGTGFFSAGNGPNRALDRWMSVTATAACTYGAAQYAQFYTKVEGYYAAHLGFGTSSAIDFKIGFWVYSSHVTGTMCVAIRDASYTNYYIAEVTINSAATWEWKEITIPAQTSGTWSTGNSLWAEIGFNLGVGSTYGGGTAGAWTSGNKIASSNQTNFMSGASYFVRVTGFAMVPAYMEFPTDMTSYGHLMYRGIAEEWDRCQRYWQSSYANGVQPGTASTSGMHQWLTGATSSYHPLKVKFPTRMVATPTVTMYSPNSGTAAKIYDQTLAGDRNAAAVYASQGGFIGRVNNVSVAAGVFLWFHYKADARL